MNDRKRQEIYNACLTLYAEKARIPTQKEVLAYVGMYSETCIAKVRNEWLSDIKPCSSQRIMEIPTSFQDLMMSLANALIIHGKSLGNEERNDQISRLASIIDSQNKDLDDFKRADEFRKEELCFHKQKTFEYQTEIDILRAKLDSKNEENLKLKERVISLEGIINTQAKNQTTMIVPPIALKPRVFG